MAIINLYLTLCVLIYSSHRLPSEVLLESLGVGLLSSHQKLVSIVCVLVLHSQVMRCLTLKGEGGRMRERERKRGVGRRGVCCIELATCTHVHACTQCTLFVNKCTSLVEYFSRSLISLALSLSHTLSPLPINIHTDLPPSLSYLTVLHLYRCV